MPRSLSLHAAPIPIMPCRSSSSSCGPALVPFHVWHPLVGRTLYVGEWKSGKRHGTGSMTYADGGVYAGGWLYGKRHGVGTFTYAGGDTYSGEWHAGNKVRIGA